MEHDKTKIELTKKEIKTLKKIIKKYIYFKELETRYAGANWFIPNKLKKIEHKLDENLELMKR